jgi:nucleotide-binding universal stress UspA family protein
MFKKILVAYDGSPDAKTALSVASDLVLKYGSRLSIAHALMRDAPMDVLRKLANRRALTKEQRDELDHYESKMRSGTATPGSGGALATVLPPTGLVEAIGSQLLDRAQKAAEKAGVGKVTTAILIGDAADAILHHATREKVDLIVLGTLGFGNFRSVVLGTVSHKVSSRANCSCLTVR